MKNAVNQDAAMKAVDAWLDEKGVRSRKRNANEDSIDTLVDAVMDGLLVFKEDTKQFVQKLQFPLGEGGTLKELTYKTRIKVGGVHKYLKGVKASDVDSRIVGYVSALTGENSDLIRGLDTEDYNIASSIAVFFF